MNTLDRFVSVIAAGHAGLGAFSAQDAVDRPKPNGWSKKEELGHLVDSAINNYARFIRVQREDAPALTNYDPDVWVERQGYQDRDWTQLISLWSALNEHMLAVARRIPPPALARTCTINGAQPITLGFLIEDYVDHMVHHLQHIGVGLDQHRRAESAYA